MDFTFFVFRIFEIKIKNKYFTVDRTNKFQQVSIVEKFNIVRYDICFIGKNNE